MNLLRRVVEAIGSRPAPREVWRDPLIAQCERVLLTGMLPLGATPEFEKETDDAED